MLYSVAGKSPILNHTHCSLSREHHPHSTPTVVSMVAGKKKLPAAAADATTNKKRPRRVRDAKPWNEEEEEDNEEPIGGDIEDFTFCGDETLEIRASLLQWYDKNQRDLPWRRISSSNDDEDDEIRAYAVWVSEIMLQQTRVQTVIDYFNRWMKKWPTIHHLAGASLEEVNEMWAGLGYYRRARYLLEGAKTIVEGGGGFPKTVSTLQKIPGIGCYTAGAIASIAFKEAVPVVDGNVVRVIARLKAISENPKDSMIVKKFWKLAGQLVDSFRPGDFNQALMELGATICTPLSPTCSACPVSGQCRALSVSRNHESALVTDYPIKVTKAKQRHDFSAICVVEILGGQYKMVGPKSKSKFLLVKRPKEGLLAGLWEFPAVLMGGEADLVTRREATDQLLKKSFDIDLKKSCSVVSREHIGEYTHIFSHIRLKMYVEWLVLQLKGELNVLCGKLGNEGEQNVLHGKPDNETLTWKYVDNKALSSMGLTSGVRKVYTMVQKFKEEKYNSIPLQKKE